MVRVYLEINLLDVDSKQWLITVCVWLLSFGLNRTYNGLSGSIDSQLSRIIWPYIHPNKYFLRLEKRLSRG